MNHRLTSSFVNITEHFILAECLNSGKECYSNCQEMKSRRARKRVTSVHQTLNKSLNPRSSVTVANVNDGTDAIKHKNVAVASSRSATRNSGSAIDRRKFYLVRSFSSRPKASWSPGGSLSLSPPAPPPAFLLLPHLRRISRFVGSAAAGSPEVRFFMRIVSSFAVVRRLTNSVLSRR